MNAFIGVNIIEVAAGTEIDHEGEKLTVTDQAAVFKGRNAYVTAKVYAKLKEHVEPRNG